MAIETKYDPQFKRILRAIAACNNYKGSAVALKMVDGLLTADTYQEVATDAREALEEIRRDLHAAQPDG